MPEATAERHTKYARTGSVNLAYQVVGSGDRELVWVPGFVSHIELNWESPLVSRFLERLASFSRLLTYDRRGTGMSDRLSGPATLEEGVDDLHAVLDDAGFKRPVIFGWSEGGPLSMLFAATYPRRVHGLALYGTFPRAVNSDDYPYGVDLDVHEGWVRGIEQHWGEASLAHMFAPSVVGDKQAAADFERYLRLGSSPAEAAALLRLYQQIDVRPVLDALHVPTLVLHREGDRMADPRGGRYIADRVGAAEFVALKGTDHLPWAGDVDAIIDRVHDFISSLEGEPDTELSLATLMAVLGVDELPRDLLDRFRGRVVREVGDGVVAAFDGPVRAIRCAEALHLRLADTARIALHAGAIDASGHEPGGVPIQLALGVAETAGPGDLIATSTVRDIVQGCGIAFDDRGSTTLEEALGTVSVFAIRE